MVCATATITCADCRALHTVLISKRLDAKVLEVWGLAGVKKVARFSPRQAVYLAYHRRVVFKKPRV